MKALSGFYDVSAGDRRFTCKARGQFRHAHMSPLVGDRVELDPEDRTIIRILPRSNSFIRPAVANVDRMVFVACAAKPVTDPFLIDRVSVIASSAGCTLLVVINKTDLSSGDDLYRIYSDAGFVTVRTSAETGEGLELLRKHLEGHISVMTGNSGAGKSSLLNALIPDANIETGDISERLGRGKHTTRHVEFYPLNNHSYIADTPGFASFEIGMIANITPEDLPYEFRDFQPYLGKCRFNDCCHLNDYGCAITAAVNSGEIHQTRYDSYARLYDIVKNRKPWE